VDYPKGFVESVKAAFRGERGIEADIASGHIRIRLLVESQDLRAAEALQILNQRSGRRTLRRKLRRKALLQRLYNQLK
jgi:hypothetical protein